MNANVPTLSIVFMAAAAAVCLAIPFILMIWIRRRKGADILPFFIGFAVFTLFALVIEGLINYGVSQTGFGKKLLSNTWTYALYGGLMAGLFEETGRYIAFRTVLRRRLGNDANALMYGAGHGGIEAIMTVGVTYVTYIVFAFLINSGNAAAIMSTVPPEAEEQARAILSQLTDTPSWMFLVSILERCIAIAAHIAFSVLVWFAAKKKERVLLYPLAILLHAALDFTVVILSNKLELPILAVEGALAVLTLIIVLIAYAVWKRTREPQTV